jgi:hypothetical protein
MTGDAWQYICDRDLTFAVLARAARRRGNAWRGL